MSCSGNPRASLGAMEPLAVIGMACRMPQEGDTNENFWNLLMKGKSAMTPFPKDRINMEGHYHPDVEHGGTVCDQIRPFFPFLLSSFQQRTSQQRTKRCVQFHVKGAHFINGDPAEFDHQFFSITKSEVMTLDPQQRLLMENVYHALENGDYHRPYYALPR